MDEMERQLRANILWAVKEWHMGLNEILEMPLIEFEKWSMVSDEVQNAPKE